MASHRWNQKGLPPVSFDRIHDSAHSQNLVGDSSTADGDGDGLPYSQGEQQSCLGQLT